MDDLDNFIKMNLNEDLIEEDEDVDEVQVDKKDVEREKTRFAYLCRNKKTLWLD